MKVLLFSAGLDQTSRTCSKLIFKGLEKKNNDCKSIDICKYSDKISKSVMANIEPHFLFLNKANKKYFNEREKGNALKYKSLAMKYYKLLNKEIKQDIQRLKPDVIICTHIIVAWAISEMFIRKEINEGIGTYFYMDSFVVPNGIENCFGIEHIFTISDSTYDKLIQKGFVESQIVDSYMIVEDEFFEPIPKKYTRKNLRMNKDKFTLLVYNEKVNAKENFEILKKLEKFNDRLQLIIINGEDKKTREKIDLYDKKKDLKHIFNFGTSERLNELMSCSDCIVCDYDMMMIARSFSKNLPIIFKPGAYGEEKETIQYLIDHNCALSLESLGEIKMIMKNILDEPKLFDELIKSTADYTENNSVSKFVKMLTKLEDDKNNVSFLS